MNTSLWQRHRTQVHHPATTVKPQDLDIARANTERHDWAKSFSNDLLEEVNRVPETTAAYLEQMIPRETPNSHLFTMCPACEGAPVHGNYNWSPEDPDRLTCTTCKTVYPNADYPEDFVIETDFGGGQKITYYTGKHWDLIGFPFVSSWTANIRAQKCSHMANLARRLGLAYALTGNVEFAQKARDILLRFAHVYPGYMVHSGYGEFSDLDPETASQHILDLPKPKLVIPPNKPNNKLHVGYWMAGRATGVGMEGIFISHVTIAYDLTCEAQANGHPIYSEEDRLAIEKDLLLEGTILLCADPNFNNKSATNRCAAGLVGLCLGEPELVRFGLEGFNNFVHEWFLEDGLSSESPGYGFMTLNGIRAFGDAMQGYSDPEGYESLEGRIDNLDIYGDSRYRAVQDGYVHSLMPDLGYGVIADDNTNARMSVDIADILAARYGEADHVALLAELCEHDLEHHGGEYALFHRNPDLAENPDHPLILTDQFFPCLRIGLLRTGQHGRASTALLSASDWGGHHHEDSLNLVYWKDGHDALMDLGYLWDRPDKQNTVRTMAHNTVLVDGQPQKRQGRGGSLHLFDTTSRVKVMQVSSCAYDAADTYTRLCLIVDHGHRGSYLIDVFRVQGGAVHDYLFHGPVPEGTTHNLELQETQAQWQDLKNLATAQAENPWSISFELDRQHQLTVYALPDGEERVLIGDGWGERGTGSRDNVMTGETVPYVIRQKTGDPANSTFASLFDISLRARPFIWEVQRLNPTRGEGVAFYVTGEEGSDLIAICPPGQTAAFHTPDGDLETTGPVTVFSLTPDGEPEFTYLLGGPQAALGSHSIELEESVLEGRILKKTTTEKESFYHIDQPNLSETALGRTFLVQGGPYETGYPIRKIE
ncbi:MAG: heparinase II/III family protein, partial [bacterium]|nr:heparinase II/III family protein [bacterium]